MPSVNAHFIGSRISGIKDQSPPVGQEITGNADNFRQCSRFQANRSSFRPHRENLIDKIVFLAVKCRCKTAFHCFVEAGLPGVDADDLGAKGPGKLAGHLPQETKTEYDDAIIFAHCRHFDGIDTDAREVCGSQAGSSNDSIEDDPGPRNRMALIVLFSLMIDSAD